MKDMHVFVLEYSIAAPVDVTDDPKVLRFEIEVHAPTLDAAYALAAEYVTFNRPDDFTRVGAYQKWLVFHSTPDPELEQKHQEWRTKQRLNEKASAG